MTIEEVALELGKSVVTLTRNFVRTANTLAKKGIILTRVGRGKTAQYFIEYNKNVSKEK